MKLKKLFISLFLINIVFLCFVVFIITEYQNVIKELENAYQTQHKSLVLADELRQSSDDLTRVARTYVITGNQMYEEQFKTILDIRNGLQARPKHYNRIYWDFLTLNNSIPILEGKTIPLREMMREAGFLESELQLLYKSQQESDDLTSLETKAMNAVKGIFKNNENLYKIKDKPDLKLAAKIMYSREYHKAKIAIMKPLNEFYKAFEIRTYQRVQVAHKKVKQQERYVGIVILCLIGLVIFSFIIILSRIIYPLEVLKNIMLRLSKNDMQVSIPVKRHMDEVGEIAGTIEIFKSNAIKLIESEQKNKSLLDLAGEGIFGLDNNARFTFLNPMACKLLGYEDQELLIGKYIYETILDSEINKKSILSKKLMILKEDSLNLKKKNKELFPIDYVSTPIYNKSNFLNGSVVVFNDRTNRNKHENQLKKAIKDAKAANHSKSIFLANMSHELRTPLNAILGFTELLMHSNTMKVKEKENLRTIENSGKHLLSLINEILELSKIEAGKIIICSIDFDLYNSLENINQMFSSRYEEKGIDFKVNISKNVPRYINCDEQRLRQIIINLLGNALKFTKKGNVSLNVEIKNECLYCEVVDTGIGIEEKDKELIFKPFEQINFKSYTNNSTGLGLCITKELVKRMGGSISVYSELNKGSKFVFSVDYVQVKKSNTIKSKKNFSVISCEKTSKIYSILVVDDIKANRDLLVQNLEIFGFHIFQAKNSFEAISAFNAEDIDLIYMDILMPDVDGIEITKIIRKTSKGKNVPIVAVSAHVYKEGEKKAFNAGVDSFIAKPLVQKDIVNSLVKHLNITFIYEQQSNTISSKEDKYSKKIKKELVFKIQDSIKTLDIKEIKFLIKNNDIDMNLVDEINEYLESFDFKKLTLLCEQLLLKQ